MSVLIKDMNIPESCSDCPINYDEMSCAVTGTRWWSDTMVLLDFDYTKERLHDCPLSEVSSAQPDHIADVGKKDCISRQQAIDALWKERQQLDDYMDECLKKGLMALRAGTKAERNRIEEDIEIIINSI